VPTAKIRQGYGLTETAALIRSNPVGREKPGSVGLAPCPGTEVAAPGRTPVTELPLVRWGDLCRLAGGDDGRNALPGYDCQSLR